MEGFLVVRRTSLESNVIEGEEFFRPAPHMCHLSILSSYRGFYGDIWPYHNTLIPLPYEERYGLCVVNDIRIAQEYRGKLPVDDICDLIYLSEKVLSPVCPVPGFPFLGYDLGYIGSVANYWSCVYCECLYGCCGSLKQYVQYLNKHLLFPDLGAPKEFLEERARLEEQKAPLETLEVGEILHPVAIFGEIDVFRKIARPGVMGSKT